jgi:hypothetical protein
MDKRFSQHCSSFLLDNVLRPLATYVKTQSAEIANKDIETLIQSFKDVLDLHTSTASPHQSTSSLVSPSLASSMNGSKHPSSQHIMPPFMSNLQGIGPGLGAIPPGKATSKTRSKVAKGVSLWYTLEQFTEAHKQGAQLCAYCPPRGQFVDHVCCAPAINSENEPDYTKWRCKSDLSKTGKLVTALNKQIQGIVPSTFPGYNAPTVGTKTTSYPQLPAFPNVPGGMPIFGNSQQQQEQPELNVKTCPGLKANIHYLIHDPLASNWLLQSPEMIVRGKFKYPVEDGHQFKPDYEQDIIPLTSEEAEIAKQSFGVRFVWSNSDIVSNGSSVNNQLNSPHALTSVGIPSIQSTGGPVPIKTLGQKVSGLGPGLPTLESVLPPGPGGREFPKLPGLNDFKYTGTGFPGINDIPGILR